jgi:hypothetical protein
MPGAIAFLRGDCVSAQISGMEKILHEDTFRIMPKQISGGRSGARNPYSADKKAPLRFSEEQPRRYQSSAIREKTSMPKTQCA